MTVLNFNAKLSYESAQKKKTSVMTYELWVIISTWII